MDDAPFGILRIDPRAEVDLTPDSVGGDQLPGRLKHGVPEMVERGIRRALRVYQLTAIVAQVKEVVGHFGSWSGAWTTGADPAGPGNQPSM